LVKIQQKKQRMPRKTQSDIKEQNRGFRNARERVSNHREVTFPGDFGALRRRVCLCPSPEKKSLAALGKKHGSWQRKIEAPLVEASLILNKKSWVKYVCIL
jgi:hypothetical protein